MNEMVLSHPERRGAQLLLLLAFSHGQRFAFGSVVAIPLGNLDDVVTGLRNDRLAAEA